jgi:hypothetical protein
MFKIGHIYQDTDPRYGTIIQITDCINNIYTGNILRGRKKNYVGNYLYRGLYRYTAQDYNASSDGTVCLFASDYPLYCSHSDSLYWGYIEHLTSWCR